MSRLIEMADLHTAQPDDLIYRDDEPYIREYQFFPPTELPSCNVFFSVARTRRRGLAYFGDVIAAVLANNDQVEIALTMADWLATEVLTRPVPPWQFVSLRISNIDTRHHHIIAFSEEDGMGNEHRTRWSAGWDDAWRQFDASREPQTVVEYEPRRDAREHFAWRHLGGVLLSGPTRYLADQLALLTGRAVRLYPVDRGPDGWVPHATFRWPYAHAVITDAVLALGPLCLPAYVLLWILDWLPPLHLSAERKKIELIQGLIASRVKIGAGVRH